MRNVDYLSLAAPQRIGRSPPVQVCLSCYCCCFHFIFGLTHHYPHCHHHNDYHGVIVMVVVVIMMSSHYDVMTLWLLHICCHFIYRYVVVRLDLYLDAIVFCRVNILIIKFFIFSSGLPYISRHPSIFVWPINILLAYPEQDLVAKISMQLHSYVTVYVAVNISYHYVRCWLA